MPDSTQTQAPEISPIQKLLGPLGISGAFWVQLHRWAIKILPTWLIWPITLLFATFFFLLLGRIRQAIANNQELAVGRVGWWQRQRRVYRTIWNHAWCLTERYERAVTERRGNPRFEGLEHWERLFGSGQGFVMTTAHVGHWELGSLMASALEIRNVHVVREKERDPRVQAFTEKIIREQGQSHLTVHFVGTGELFAAKLLFALRRGEIVALQGDRPSTEGRKTEVSFFGQPLQLPIGPALLARMAEVPILPVFAFREGRMRSRVVFRPPIQVPMTDDRDADIDRTMQEVADQVAWAIRQEPSQWFCFRELWPKAKKEAI